MSDCHVFVDAGITNPKSKYHSSKHFPLNMTFCSSLNFVISCSEEKFNSLETALHFKIFFGTLASCSGPGADLQKHITKMTIKTVTSQPKEQENFMTADLRIFKFSL